MTTSRRPRKPHPIQLVTDHSWSDRRYTELDTYSFWFKKARQLNPEHFSELVDFNEVPISLLAGLYPEIVALGPCAPTITKAFNTIKAAERYLKRGPFDTKSPMYKGIEEYVISCRESTPYPKTNEMASFLFYTEPGVLHRRFERTFELIKTNSLYRAYSFRAGPPLGTITAAAIHLVHPEITIEPKPPHLRTQAQKVVKALQKLEQCLLQEEIITPEYLTNITLPSKAKAGGKK